MWAVHDATTHALISWGDGPAPGAPAGSVTISIPRAPGPGDVWSATLLQFVPGVLVVLDPILSEIRATLSAIRAKTDKLP